MITHLNQSAYWIVTFAIAGDVSSWETPNNTKYPHEPPKKLGFIQIPGSALVRVFVGINWQLDYAPLSIIVGPSP